MIRLELTEREARALTLAISTYRWDYDHSNHTMWRINQKVLAATKEGQQHV